jgi:tellurite resistance protein TerC
VDQIWFWIGFNVFILGMLALDLGVFNRRAHHISVKESLGWIALWVSLALLFNLWIYFEKGPVKALEFFTGYIIELSLSVDNLFVFLVVFSYFRVPDQYKHRVLFWGIVGALVLRAVFILAGLTLIHYFTWINYVFGAILLYTGIRMLFHSNDAPPELDKNLIVRLWKRYFPVHEHYVGKKFFIRENGILKATPLFIVLLVVEATDVMFAIDSIPAVLSVSKDPFIVYTSNVFAILGLRSIFFALSNAMDYFRFLKYGLALILGFVGFKMIISHFYHLPIEFALSAVLIILAGSIFLSILYKGYRKPASGK